MNLTPVQPLTMTTTIKQTIDSVAPEHIVSISAKIDLLNHGSKRLD